MPVETDSRWAYISEADGWFWIRAENGTWLSLDGESWTEVAMDGVPAPAVDGLIWRMSVVGTVALDGKALAALRWWGELPYARILGIDDSEYEGIGGCVEFGDEVMKVEGYFADRSADLLAVWSIEHSGDTVRIIDVDTGTVLHTVTTPGSSMDPTALESLLSWGYVSAGELAIIDPSGSISVVNTELPIGDRPAISGIDGSAFVLTQVRNEDGVTDVELWVSDDGLEWASLGPPAFLSGDQTNFVSLDEVGGVLFATTEDDRGVGHWSSSDGVEWIVVGADRRPGDWLTFYLLDDGWVAAGDFLGQEAWVSSDGMAWDRVDTSSIDIQAAPVGAGGFHGATLGNTLTFRLTESQAGIFDEWVLTLVPRP